MSGSERLAPGNRLTPCATKRTYFSRPYSGQATTDAKKKLMKLSSTASTPKSITMGMTGKTKILANRK